MWLNILCGGAILLFLAALIVFVIALMIELLSEITRVHPKEKERRGP